MFRPFFYICIGFLLAIIQVSFFSVLPYLNSLNLILIFLVYLAIKNNSGALPFAVISGYLLDIYSSYPFGMHIAALLAVCFLSNYAYLRIFTNHRFFPIVILLSICITIYHLMILNLTFILSFLKISEKIQISAGAVFVNIGLEIFCTLILVSIIYSISYITKKKISAHLLVRQ